MTALVPSLADTVADGLVELAAFVREHPEFAEAFISGYEQFRLRCDVSTFDSRARALDGHHDTELDGRPICWRRFGEFELVVEVSP